jgi:hypothetical protein
MQRGHSGRIDKFLKILYVVCGPNRTGKRPATSFCEDEKVKKDKKLHE